jgi:hypothetical protein
MTPRNKMKARVKCPFCEKENVRVTITPRKGGVGVDTALHTHTGQFVDPVTGKPKRCPGVGQPVNDLPPMNEWEPWTP